MIKEINFLRNIPGNSDGSIVFVDGTEITVNNFLEVLELIEQRSFTVTEIALVNKVIIDYEIDKHGDMKEFKFLEIDNEPFKKKEIEK